MGSIMSSVEDINLDDTTYRILSYNVEWGFLKVPDDINKTATIVIRSLMDNYTKLEKSRLI